MGPATLRVLGVPLVFTAVLLVSAQPAAAAGLRDACRLLWFDVDTTGPSAFDGALEEAAGILTHAGLRCVFTRGDSTGGVDEIFIIFKRRRPSGSATKPLTMGQAEAVPRQPGGVQVVWIYIEPILKTLMLRSLDDDRPRVTRAIGRVIAHEVIHIVAPQLGHSRRGLMAASLRVNDLVGADVQLDPRFAAALQEFEQIGRPAAVTDERITGPYPKDY